MKVEIAPKTDFQPIIVSITLESLEEAQDLYNVLNLIPNVESCEHLQLGIIKEKLKEVIGYDSIRATFPSYAKKMRNSFVIDNNAI